MAVDHGLHMPAIRPLRGLGGQRDLVARDLRLRGAFLAIKLAVAAGMNGIVARDVEHPAPRHLCPLLAPAAAHGLSSIPRAKANAASRRV